ncbi:3-deoxy-7-phosphoheptulonate synthase [Thermincola ferriacetica]
MVFKALFILGVRTVRHDALVSRETKKDDTIVDIKGIKVGGNNIVIIAGPCAIEDKEQYLETAVALKRLGAHMLRGGAFKPRTSPYTFQGLAEEGLKIIAEAKELTEMPVVTEVLDTRDVELIARYCDVIQVGSRNMQNFVLLKEVGRSSLPVLLKRGLSATIEEWLLAAEYIMAEGNHNVILCERGIRTFETYTRNTLDISAIPAVKHLSHLPVIVDPSHAAGRWGMVGPLSRSAVAAGADGLLIEVHPEPELALCDGGQSLTPENFAKLMKEVRAVAAAVDRTCDKEEKVSCQNKINMVR